MRPSHSHPALSSTKFRTEWGVGDGRPGPEQVAQKPNEVLFADDAAALQVDHTEGQVGFASEAAVAQDVHVLDEVREVYLRESMRRYESVVVEVERVEQPV